MVLSRYLSLEGDVMFKARFGVFMYCERCCRYTAFFWVMAKEVFECEDCAHKRYAMSFGPALEGASASAS